ncbi:MAG: hypothetical protein ACR2RA_07160, partial [Geminicoccaceae bacterium]
MPQFHPISPCHDELQGVQRFDENVSFPYEESLNSSRFAECIAAERDMGAHSHHQGGARAAWLIGNRAMRQAHDGVHAREGIAVVDHQALGKCLTFAATPIGAAARHRLIAVWMHRRFIETRPPLRTSFSA